MQLILSSGCSSAFAPFGSSLLLPLDTWLLKVVTATHLRKDTALLHFSIEAPEQIIKALVITDNYVAHMASASFHNILASINQSVNQGELPINLAPTPNK
jgi:hypothetical protein